MITTGHSLGAATSSIFHILLVLMSQDEQMKTLDYHNIGFATPLFGNLELNPEGCGGGVKVSLWVFDWLPFLTGSCYGHKNS